MKRHTECACYFSDVPSPFRGGTRNQLHGRSTEDGPSQTIPARYVPRDRVFGRMPDLPEDDPARVVVVGKSNYGPTGTAYELRLSVPPGEGHPAISYVGRSDVESGQLLADPVQRETRQERAVAVEFLERVLAGGERVSVDVYAEADAEGISSRTLDRARTHLGVMSRREGFGRGGKTFMSLPGSAGGAS